MTARNPHRAADSVVTANITNLLNTVSELKTAVNALRVDFTKHDHGETYAAASLRQNTAVNTTTSGTFTSAVVAGTIPSFLIDDASM
jgi:hypothetical protein